MAKMKIADAITPEVYLKYFRERSIYESNFFKSGVITVSPKFNSLVAGGGTQFNTPYWNSIVKGVASEVLSDSSALTLNKTTAEKQIARRLERGIAYGVNDLVEINAGDDPMLSILSELGDYWDSDREDVLLAILKGVFADNLANDSGDLIYDIAAEAIGDQSDDTKFSANAFLSAINLMGDKSRKFGAIAVHSAVHLRMQQLDLIDNVQTHAQDIGFGTYLGHTIIVEDNLPTIAGATSGTKYVSYIFAPGAIAYGESYGELLLETNREILDGDDQIASRRIMTMHPEGFAWQEASVAGNSPTNAELSDATNWDRVFEKKNIGIVRLVTN